MRRWSKVIAILTAAALCLSGCGLEESPDSAVSGNPQESGASAAPGERRVILAGDDVELDIRPQDDFYGYVNAQTLWNLSVPFGETTAGGFDDVYRAVDAQLDDIILEIISSEKTFEPGSDEQMIRDYYALCKSGRVTDKKLFEEMFSMIDSVQSPEDLVRVSAQIGSRYGVSGLYSFTVRTDPFCPEESLLDLNFLDTFMNNLNDLYEDDRSVNQARESCADILMGLGADYEDANTRADNILYLWLDIAAETDFEALEKYDVEKLSACCTLSDLQEFLPVGDVKEFLKLQGMKDSEIRAVKEVRVMQPEQMRAVKGLLTGEKLDAWKDYLKCAVCGVYSAYLPKEYTLNEVFEEEMEQDEILKKIKEDCYDNLSPLYYERYYTPELAERMDKMMADIKGAYIKMIRGADWLTPQGRELFVEKLESIHPFFGGQEGRDTDPRRKDLVGDTLLETAVRMAQFRKRRNYENLLKQTDITQWSMGSQEVNAYYSPELNSIYVCAGILHAPFYDPETDDFTNLGGIGAVICHELSHAFDNTGILYDKDGRYDPGWVSSADRDAFAEVVEKVDAHYDDYALLEVYHVDGEKTVGENLADLGGLQCVLSLAKTDEQRRKLFENYARIWCTLYQKDNLIMYLNRDVHSPNPVRVNAVLSCFEEFYDLYDVTPEDGMYLAPERRVKRW